ncbi:hypothetical protein ACIBL8_45975 [Streptomyces sp. NPDC050523]|uniref:hypothetical protein n=1 Tax=Streptomyces sp. NPDC050523 TaxID=3365622 RepID=UPI003799AFE5
MIWNAARNGRRHEAGRMVAVFEQGALRAHGPASPEAIHWLEVRAQLAQIADDPGAACELWLAATGFRLNRGESPDAEDVVVAVDQATHEWGRLRDSARARYLAPKLIVLRKRIFGSYQEVTRHIERRLVQVHEHHAPSDLRLGGWPDEVGVSPLTADPIVTGQRLGRHRRV